MRFGTTVWPAVLIPALFLAPAFAQTKAGTTKAPAASASAASSAAPAGSAAPAASAAPAPAVTGPTTAATGQVSNAAPAGSAPAGMDGATYAVRLRDLERRMDELKEQIRRSHTRLSLLTDTILSGGVAGSRADIQFQNEMSSAFKLTKALFVLDGAIQYNKADDTGALADQHDIPIFNGSIPPGDHTMQVLLQLQGNGYGVFSYLRGYHFEVKSSHSFTAVEGKTLTLQVIAYEKGGVTTALEERPAVRYAEKITSGISNGQAAAPGAGAPGSPPSGNVSTGFSIGTGGK